MSDEPRTDGAGPAAAEQLRPLLFGDVPVERWPVGDDTPGEPWQTFVGARRHLAAGDQDLAIRDWARVPLFPAVESRHVAQAWSFLRSVNVHPDAAIAAHVLGVVVEVPVDAGHDVLAGYEDGSVRYLHCGGGVTVVEAATVPTVVAALAGLLAAGRLLAERIGTWTEPARPALLAGHLRVSVLTPGGLRFGQGPEAAVAADPSAGGVLVAATQLLVAMVALGS